MTRYNIVIIAVAVKNLNWLFLLGFNKTKRIYIRCVQNWRYLINVINTEVNRVWIDLRKVAMTEIPPKMKRDTLYGVPHDDVLFRGNDNNNNNNGSRRQLDGCINTERIIIRPLRRRPLRLKAVWSTNMHNSSAIRLK